MSSEAAQALLGLRFDDGELNRLHELATKDQDNTLTPAEHPELASDLRISCFLDLIQSKVRRSLRNDA